MGVAASMRGPRRHAPAKTPGTSLLDERRIRSGRSLAAAAEEGGPWRGVREALWISRLLRGAPPPHDIAHSLAVPAAHG